MVTDKKKINKKIVIIKKKKEKQAKSLCFELPGGRSYSNRKHLIFWESALFSG